MATEANKKTTKKAAPKKEAKTKVPSKTETAKATVAKKTEGKKAVSASGKVKVTQLVGSIGRQADQRATLVGLGLNKRHRSKVLEDTPSVRGMIYKVRHLIKVESAG